MKNHRVVVPRRGGPDVMQIIEEDLPRPDPTEIRIKVQAAGVSGLDPMVRAGSFPGFPKVPFTPGCDVVGEVDTVGASVKTIEPGEVVTGGPMMSGGYTEYICLPADEVVPVPPGVDPAEAVCLVANYLTANLMMHGIAEVRAGERILVQGAAGGVGSALLELGGLAGLEMYGTASRHNHDFVASLGATPIDYHNEDVVERIRELTGDGVDVVFDPIGGAGQLWRSYRALRKGGRLVWFGVASTHERGVRVIPASLVMRFLLALIPDGRKVPLPPTPEAREQTESMAELLDLLAAGKISPVVAERIPLAEATRAHELLERGGLAGKLVLVPDG